MTALNFSAHLVLLMVLWFAALPAFACGDSVPDPATTPPVVRVLAI